MAVSHRNSSNNNNDIRNHILVEAHSNVWKLILNRPYQLNAISLQMLSRLCELLIAYEKDQNVNLVILKGRGKAFCVGGDMAALAHAVVNGNWKLGAKFFWSAYSAAYMYATSSTPQVSILNGIVMGAGAPISIHGKFRVATENSVFATPETALGLFPDGGASYFLPRLPGFFGEYVGLTGARLDGAEMLACGLATHFVPSTRLSLLEDALTKVNTADATIISAIIDKFSQRPLLKDRSPCHRLDIVDKCFSKKTVEEILSALQTEVAVNRGDGYWISSAIQSLKNVSPISLKITLKSIREGRLQDVGQCLVQEYRMCCHVLRNEVSKDFFEGCRAILWDKDRKPKWEPSKLELVSDQMVDQYFTKVDDEEWEDLGLPVWSHVFAASTTAKL